MINGSEIGICESLSNAQPCGQAYAQCIEEESSFEKYVQQIKSHSPYDSGHFPQSPCRLLQRRLWVSLVHGPHFHHPLCKEFDACRGVLGDVLLSLVSGGHEDMLQYVGQIRVL